MPENLEAIMTRFKNSTQTLEHINNLSLLIKQGKVTLATGERSVALGGNDKQRSFLHQVAPLGISWNRGLKLLISRGCKQRHRLDQQLRLKTF